MTGPTHDATEDVARAARVREAAPDVPAAAPEGLRVDGARSLTPARLLAVQRRAGNRATTALARGRGPERRRAGPEPSEVVDAGPESEEQDAAEPDAAGEGSPGGLQAAGGAAPPPDDNGRAADGQSVVARAGASTPTAGWPLVLRDRDRDEPRPPGTGDQPGSQPTTTGQPTTPGSGTGATDGTPGTDTSEPSAGSPGTDTPGTDTPGGGKEPGKAGPDGKAGSDGKAPTDEDAGRPDTGEGSPGSPDADTPLSPAEKAARADGALAPDAEEGYTELKSIPGVDPKVAEIFEKRADPAAREEHEKLLAQAEGLRLSSMGYSYKEGGFGAAMLSLVNPAPGFMEGWGRLTGDNIYSSGTGVVAALQSGIDRYRGYLKILDTVAGWVSIAATAVAAIAAITIVGAPVAAVAFKVGVVAGLIQAGIKALDAFLGVVQLIINIARARSTDDPIERARLCHQMKQESGQFADSLMGAVVDGVSSAGGGAGKALAQAGKAGLKAGMKGGVKAGLKAGGKKALFKGAAAARLMRIKAKAAARQGLQVAGKLRSASGIRQLLGSAATSVGNRIPLTKGWTAAKVAAYNKNLGTKIAGMRKHARAKYAPDASWKTLSASTGKQLGKEAAGHLGVGSAKGVVKEGIKAGMGSESAVAGGGPPSMGPGGGPDIGLTYHQVAYWPSVLEQMGGVRGDIHKAQGRMKKEYDKAATDAGDKKQFIEGIKGEPSQVGTRLRMAGGKQKAEAEAARERADETGEKADEALDEEQKAKGEVDKSKKSAEDTEKDARTAEDAANKDASSKESRGFWGTVADYAKSAYNATLGKLFNGLNVVKKKIGDAVLELAMGLAGLGDDDLQLAGMKTQAEKDAEASEEAKEEAEATKEEADEHDKQIAEAKENASDQEAAAMQAMVDAGDYIEALDAYDQALAEQQDHGTNYVQDATEAVAAEADAPLVTTAFIRPILDATAWIAGQAGSFPASLASAGNTAVAGLAGVARARGAAPEAVSEIGGDVVKAWVEAANSLCQQIATHAGKLASGANGLVGTDWFVVVDDQYAPQVEQLAATLDGLAAAAAASIQGVLAELASAYGGAAEGLDEAEVPVPVPAPGAAEPPEET